MENPQENTKEEKTLHDLKEEFVEDLHIATAIENDEVNNEEMQKGDALENLEYADGKQRDEIDLVEEQEKIYGVDVVSPFKTGDIRVFRRKLETMSRDRMTALANRVAARTYSSEEDQKEELIKAFYSWASTNSFIQTDATKKAEIATKKQALRDAPADSAIDAASTETELKLQWNTAILGTSPYN